MMIMIRQQKRNSIQFKFDGTAYYYICGDIYIRWLANKTEKLLASQKLAKERVSSGQSTNEGMHACMHVALNKRTETTNGEVKRRSIDRSTFVYTVLYYTL